MPEVAVVTDSTSYLPRALVAAHDIHEVSLYVADATGQRRELDIDDYTAFYSGLRDAAQLPTTSQPSIGDFAAVYAPLAAEGRDIVSVHISGGISGTLDSARQAAAQVAADHAGRRIEVVDSTVSAGALGLVALAAAGAARAGGDAGAVVAPPPGPPSRRCASGSPSTRSSTSVAAGASAPLRRGSAGR